MVNYDEYAPTKKDIDLKAMPVGIKRSKSRKVLQTKRLAAEAKASFDPEYVSEDLRRRYMSGKELTSRPLIRLRSNG